MSREPLTLRRQAAPTAPAGMPAAAAVLFTGEVVGSFAVHAPPRRQQREPAEGAADALSGGDHQQCGRGSSHQGEQAATAECGRRRIDRREAVWIAWLGNGVCAIVAQRAQEAALPVRAHDHRELDQVGEMAHALADAVAEEAPRPVVTGQWRAGDVRHVFASPARARDALGFAVQEDFGERMREFAAAPLRA
jgi:hypothetical protein